MICTITQFHNCLRNPELLLRTIHDVEYEPETLTSTRYFAECRARIAGSKVMMYAPITPQSMTIAEQAIDVLGLAHGEVGEMEIIHNEIICHGKQTFYCDLIIERLHSGIKLSEAIHTLSHSCLMLGLNMLHDTLKQYDISHNHLSVDNIIVDEHYVWHPLRSYYAMKGYGGDGATLEHITSLIDEYAIPDLSRPVAALHENLSAYTTSAGNNIIRYPLHERRRRITTPRGTGFEDENGRMVIDDIYLSASDFVEDRATVTTHDNKMGVIDRNGKYIIGPIYDEVVFFVDDGTLHAILNGRSATFDYFGVQITEWSE